MDGFFKFFFTNKNFHPEMQSSWRDFSKELKKEKKKKKPKDFDQTSTMENFRSKVDILRSYECGKTGITSKNALQP